MGTLTYSHTLVAGAAENINHVQDMFNDARTVINGNIDSENLASAEKNELGLSDSTTIRRGKSIIATEESRTNTAYGLLTTPDRVSSVALPTDGLIVITYQATWKNSVAGAGNAALFLGANQLKVVSFATSTDPVVQEAGGNTSADTYRPIASSNVGLATTSSATVYNGDVTTGQIVSSNVGGNVGGSMYIFAAAGTYDVSVQFKSTSGSVTVKGRKLWVMTIGF